MELVSTQAFWADKLLAAVFLSGFIFFGFRLRKDFRLWFCLVGFLAFLMLFSVMRFVLFFCFYKDVFQTLTALQVLHAFWDGIPFDLCATATLGSVGFVSFLIPVTNKTYYKIVAWFVAGMWSVVLWACVGDMVYFSFVKRHTGSELWLAVYDMDLLVSLVHSQYMWIVAVLILLSAAMGWAISKLVDRYYQKPHYAQWNYVCTILLACVILFFAFRGHFGFRFRPLAVADAYKQGSIPQGNLALNGVFCMYKSLSKKYAPLPQAVSAEESLQRTKQLLASSEEEFISEGYPLLRRRTQFNANGKQYNLVVLLLESWQYRYTDALAGTHYGATPYLDELIGQSVVFDRFYASGQRSINGVGTVMTGVAQLAGLPYFSLGLEAYHFAGIAQLLSQKGYDTVFAQPADWKSASIGLVAELAGFQEIYCREDMSSLLDYIHAGTISDYDALQFLAEKLEGRTRPFAAFFFSAATHPPFSKMHADFDRFVWNGEDKGYLNALNYMDWSIGQFVQQLKAHGQYENTVFIVLADHTLGWGESGDLYTRFHIPLFIHAPSLLSARRSNVVGSQVDILPTIIDLLQIDVPYVAMGSSLFDSTAKRFAFSSQDGRVLEWVRPEGELEYVGGQRIDGEHALAADEERNLLALNRAIYELLKNDQWAPSNP